MILTQQQLTLRLRSEGLKVSTTTIHAMREAGMPVVHVPGHKKPRFHWESVWAWVLGTREADAAVLDVRDRITRRHRRAG